MTMPGVTYSIRIAQHLDPECSPWLAGMAITNLDEGGAHLHGYLADQAALYGVLQCLRDLNVALLELKQEPCPTTPAAAAAAHS